MKRLLMILGGILIVAAVGWKLGISPNAERRLSPGWEWRYDTLGTWATFETEGIDIENIDESIFDRPLEEDEVAASEFLQIVVAEGFSNEQATVTSDYADVDPITRQVDYSYTDELIVNPTTARYIDPELAEYYFAFPRNTQKQTYTLWDTYYGVSDFEFMEEEIIGGLNTYLFRLAPEILDETANYIADEWILPDQAVVCYDTVVNYWVEPYTGEVVKIEETCPREYYVDPETYEPLAPYGRWQVLSSGDSIQKQVSIVSARLNTYRWMTFYAPTMLAAIGVLLGLLGIFLPQPKTDKPASA